MSAEFPLDVRRDEDEPEPNLCEGDFHVFPADAKEDDPCFCGEDKW